MRYFWRPWSNVPVIVVVSSVLVGFLLLAVGVRALVVTLVVLLQLFELVRVRCPDEVPVHVEDLSLRVHQELAVVAFDLDTPHYHIVLHVDRHLLVVFGLMNVGRGLVLVVLLVRVRVLELVVLAVVDVHVLVLAGVGRVASLSAQTAARVIFMVHLILILISELQGVAAVLGVLLGVVEVVWLLERFVLEVHRVVSLVVQEPLPFEEILAPLKRTLLLHLLEAVLIRLQDFLC